MCKINFKILKLLYLVHEVSTFFSQIEQAMINIYYGVNAYQSEASWNCTQAIFTCGYKHIPQCLLILIHLITEHYKLCVKLFLLLKVGFLWGGVDQLFGPHMEMIKSYVWLHTQESLLSGDHLGCQRKNQGRQCARQMPSCCTTAPDPITNS